MHPNVKSWLRRFSREWILPILTVVVICGAFRSAVADWNDVPTGSMQPTILEGDRILVNKLAYGLRVPFTNLRLAEWDQPARGDIVICFSPANGDRLVKRVVARPGDTVEMRNNQVLINGSPLAYTTMPDDSLVEIPDELRPQRAFATEQLPGHPHTVMITPQIPARRSFAPVVVPAGHYFVMGDNRDESADSRYFGFVPEQQIVGRTSRVAFSLDRNHWYIPRWDRFFQSLN